MRKILFRGKREDNGEWVYGGFYQWLKLSYITCDNFDTYAKTTFGVIPEAVGQYTGLTDKNGTKIFEGDIVKGLGEIGVVDYNEDFAKFTVNYNENSGNWYDFEGDSYPLSLDLEVIGNIHDNPELLK